MAKQVTTNTPPEGAEPVLNNTENLERLARAAAVEYLKERNTKPAYALTKVQSEALEREYQARGVIDIPALVFVFDLSPQRVQANVYGGASDALDSAVSHIEPHELKAALRAKFAEYVPFTTRAGWFTPQAPEIIRESVNRVLRDVVRMLPQAGGN